MNQQIKWDCCKWDETRMGFSFLFCVMFVTFMEAKQRDTFFFLAFIFLGVSVSLGATATTQAPVPRVWILWGFQANWWLMGKLKVGKSELKNHFQWWIEPSILSTFHVPCIYKYVHIYIYSIYICMHYIPKMTSLSSKEIVVVNLDGAGNSWKGLGYEPSTWHSAFADGFTRRAHLSVDLSAFIYIFL